MKLSRLVFLSLIASHSAFANNCPFEGLYGGINLGYSLPEMRGSDQTLIDLSLLASSKISVQHNGNKVTDSSIVGGLAIGYGFALSPMFLVSAEARANFQDTHPSVNRHVSEERSTFLVDIDHSAKLNRDFGLLAKLGLTFDPNVQLYGLVGINWGHITASSHNAYSQRPDPAFLLGASLQNQRSSYESGLLLGLGMEYLFLPCLSLSAEFEYVDYGTLNFPDPLSTLVSVNGVPEDQTLFSASQSYKMNNNRANIRLNYYFG